MTIWPASSAGSTSFFRWSRRSAAKSRARVSRSAGCASARMAINARMSVPIRPPDGSLVQSAGRPWACRKSWSNALWVVVPAPSMPSMTINCAAFIFVDIGFFRSSIGGGVFQNLRGGIPNGRQFIALGDGFQVGICARAADISEEVEKLAKVLEVARAAEVAGGLDEREIGVFGAEPLQGGGGGDNEFGVVAAQQFSKLWDRPVELLLARAMNAVEARVVGGAWVGQGLQDIGVGARGGRLCRLARRPGFGGIAGAKRRDHGEQGGNRCSTRCKTREARFRTLPNRPHCTPLPPGEASPRPAEDGPSSRFR